MAEKRYLDLEGLTAFKAKCDEAYALNGALNFKGTVATISSLPTVASAHVGDMYNVITGGQTTADFVEGAGKVLDDGENVVAVNIALPNESPVMKWDILGGVLDVSNKLTFGSNMPASPDNGDTFLYLGNTTYVYNSVTPAGTENPSAEGWYEYDSPEDEYVPTEDVTVDAQKTYYTQSEQYVKGVIYVYSQTTSSWIPQSSGDVFVPITNAQINNLFE